VAVSNDVNVRSMANLFDLKQNPNLKGSMDITVHYDDNVSITAHVTGNADALTVIAGTMVQKYGAGNPNLDIIIHSPVLDN